MSYSCFVNFKTKFFIILFFQGEKLAVKTPPTSFTPAALQQTQANGTQNKPPARIPLGEVRILTKEEAVMFMARVQQSCHPTELSLSSELSPHVEKPSLIVMPPEKKKFSDPALKLLSCI
jgi:hypothetical protein